MGIERKCKRHKKKGWEMRSSGMAIAIVSPLTFSGRGSHCLQWYTLGWVYQAAWALPESWSHKWSWQKSPSHKTKQRYMDRGKGQTNLSALSLKILQLALSAWGLHLGDAPTGEREIPKKWREDGKNSGHYSLSHKYLYRIYTGKKRHYWQSRDD